VGDGDDDQGDEEPEPVATLVVDIRMDDRQANQCGTLDG
jgi:hypothetical protein